MSTGSIGSDNNIETFVFSQVCKYDGNNIKDWSRTVKSAFQSCGKSHFLKSELPISHPEYHEYERLFGLMHFTFQPKLLDHIQHLKTVFGIWEYMTRSQRDGPATAVRKYIKIAAMKYEGGELRLWFEKLTARFEDAESDWIKLNEPTRCIITFSMLPRPQFDLLADRLTSREVLTMKGLMNAFIEEDEKIKAGHSKQPNVNHQTASALTKKKFNKNSKRNEKRCDYCHRIGHDSSECHKKYWDENHKSSDSSAEKSKPSTSSTGSKPENKSSNSKHSAKSVVLKIVDDKSCNGWIIDSGSTSHATNNESILLNVKPKTFDFEAADGHSIITTKIGNSTIHLNHDHQIELNNIACGDFSSNLISVSQLMNDGYSLFFDGNSPDKSLFIIKDHNININDPIAIVNESSGVWKIDHQHHRESYNSWHHRLGHCDKSVLHQIAKQSSCVEVDVYSCDSCVNNKSISLPHEQSMIYNDVNIFEFLHVNLWESSSYSAGGNKYGLIIIDHRTLFCFGILLKSKSDATEALINFIINHESMYKKYQRRVCRIRTNCGKEFLNQRMEEFCLEHGIDHQDTVEVSSQQNDIVEKVNRNIFIAVRTLVNSANMNHKYWADAMMTAIYLINIWVPDSGLSPFESFFGHKPSYDHLHSFGCEAYCHQSKSNRDSTDRKSVV